jgi:hypothetical protein
MATESIETTTPDEKGLKERIAEIVVSSFATLGGKPEWAIQASKNYSSVSSWKAWQAGYTAVFGAGCTAIPGAHGLLIIPDLLFLLHKMAYCSWGIGALRGCRVEGETDFALILGHWSGVITEQDLPAAIALGITAGALKGALAPGILPKLVGKETAEVITKGFQKLGSKALVKGAIKGGIKGMGKGALKGVAVLGPIVGHLAGTIAEKAAEKIAAKIMAKATFVATIQKSASNAVAGFLPVIGPLAAAGINVYFMASIADSADKYYQNKRQVAKNIIE